MDNGKTGKKTGKRTMTSPRSGATVPTGAHPKNTGGKKGRSGRKPLAFKELCKDILEDENTETSMRAAARTPKLPGYAALIKMLASYADGVPEKTIVLEHESPLEELLCELDGVATRRRATKNPRKA